MTDDLFSSYGDTATPLKARDPRGDKPVKEPSAFELKMREKGRLHDNYLASRRAERVEIIAQEPRLKGFLKYLRKIGPDDGDELIEAVSESWLPASPGPVRYLALRLIDRRIEKVRQSLGLSPLDDDLPEHLGGPPGASVFFAAREILVPGGRA